MGFFLPLAGEEKGRLGEHEWVVVRTGRFKEVDDRVGRGDFFLEGGGKRDSLASILEI